MERRLPDLSSRLGEVLQDLKKAKRRREEQHQRRLARDLLGQARQDSGAGQAPGAGPGPGLWSGDESQGQASRDTASSRGSEGAAASESRVPASPGSRVLVSFGRPSEGHATGALPEEGRRSAPGQVPGGPEDSRSRGASGAGPGVEGVGGWGETWGLGRGQQGQRPWPTTEAPAEGVRGGEGGAAFPFWHRAEGPHATQALGPHVLGAAGESNSQWQSWRGVESLGAPPWRQRTPHIPPLEGRTEDPSTSAWHSHQQRGLAGWAEAGGRGGNAEAEEKVMGSHQAADGTCAPARPPRSLQISPKSIGSFVPMARRLSGADMMACLQALCSAVEGGNTAQVRRLEREIRFASSPIGNAVQRMGLLFLRGLKLRASLGAQDMAAPQLNAQLTHASPRVSPAAMASLAGYAKRVPLSNIVLASACAALLDAFSAHGRVHFLLLGYNQMVGHHHWVSLIQGLGTRPQGPPKGLRFTFVACTYNMAAAEIRGLQHWMKDVGAQLEAEASRWGIAPVAVECIEMGDRSGLQELASVCGRMAPGAERKRTGAATAPTAMKGEAASASSGSAGAGSGPDSGDSTRPHAHGIPPAAKEEPWEGQSRPCSGPSYPGPTLAPAPENGAAPEAALREGGSSALQLGMGQAEVLPDPGGGGVEGAAWGRGVGAEAGSGDREGLCVCTLMSLYNLVDDSRLNPNPRQALMEWVKELAPDLFLVAEMPVDQASRSPGVRFQHCVQYYAPLLDLHDAVMKQEKAQGQGQGTRGSGSGAGTGAGAGGGAGGWAGGGLEGEQEGIFHFEQCFLGRHVNKCIGPTREKLIHTQGLEAWQADMARLGYADAPWEAPTQDFVRRCLQGLPSDLHIRFSGAIVTFLWRGQVLYFVGKWRLPHA